MVLNENINKLNNELLNKNELEKENKKIIRELKMVIQLNESLNKKKEDNVRNDLID